MAFGGYNQIDLANLGSELHPKALRVQSARAALYLYLRNVNCHTIYVPNYICDSIFPALISLNLKVEFYCVGSDLLPENLQIGNFGSGIKILIVNYFGLLDSQIKKITEQNLDLFIVDSSQALFCDYTAGTAAIYSPRKYLGIPDGGLLSTPEKIELPDDIYDASDKFSHLLIRAAGDVQVGYKRFLASEQSLECYIPKRMSIISEYLISCSDLAKIASKRRHNYNILYSKFKSINRFDLPIEDNVPLCYPLMLEFGVSDILGELIEDSIYLPRYWNSKYLGDVGRSIFNNTLFLPIDERLTDKCLLKLSNIIEMRIKDEYKR
jgi:hypothetical protein